MFVSHCCQEGGKCSDEFGNIVGSSIRHLPLSLLPTFSEHMQASILCFVAMVTSMSLTITSVNRISGLVIHDPA